MNVLRVYAGLFRRSPALTRLLAGEFVSGIGDWIYLVAIMVVVYSESQSAVVLGIVGAARILPWIILSVPAGIVADRYDRRVVLLVTDVARGILMLAIAVAVIVDAPTLGIVGLSIAAACFSAFFGPAIAALLPTLVDEEDLGPANSAWATLDSLAFIIGPALAGLLLATGSLAIAFVINAISFGVVAFVLWRLPLPQRVVAIASPRPNEADAPPPPDADEPSWRELARPLSGPFVLDAATSFVGGGLTVLTVLIADQVLRAGDAGIGYLNAAIGVGGVVAGFASGALFARRLGLPLVVGGAVGALGLAWLAVAGNLLVAMLAIGLAVAGFLLLDVVNTTLIQRIVPDRMRGRAVGFIGLSSNIVYTIGSLVMPIAADILGVGPVLVGSAAVVVVGVVGTLLLTEARATPEAVGPAGELLRRHPIFAGLPAPRLESAATRLQPVAVPAGEVVVREGEPADRFYVIADGDFRVTQGAEGRELRELHAGDVFGEIGLLRRSPRTATVTALTDANLLALDADDFHELVGSGPGLGNRLLDLYRGASAR